MFCISYLNYSKFSRQHNFFPMHQSKNNYIPMELVCLPSSVKFSKRCIENWLPSSLPEWPNFQVSLQGAIVFWGLKTKNPTLGIIFLLPFWQVYMGILKCSILIFLNQHMECTSLNLMTWSFFSLKLNILQHDQSKWSF